MKRIIMFVLLFAALKVAGQTTGYLRFDTVKIMKQNGYCELYIINKTKDSLGLLTNVGGGLTEFIKPKMLNDSTIIIGLDTLVIPGSGSAGGSATLSNVGSGYRLVKTADGQVKTEFAGYGIIKDSTTNTDAITDRVDTSSTNHVVTQSDLNDSSRTIRMRYNTPPTEPYGVIYHKDGFTSTSDITPVGAFTADYSGGAIGLSGGSGTFTNYGIIGGYTLLPQWSITTMRKVNVINGTSYGFGQGVKSDNPNGQFDVLGRIVTATGTVGDLVLNNSTGTSLATGSGPSISAGDEVELTITFNDSVVTLSARNVTTSSSTSTISYTFTTSGSPYVPNTSRFALYEFGGTDSLKTIDIRSTAPRNPNVLYMTDSKGIYFAQYWANRTGKLLNTTYPTVLSYNGGADGTAETLQKLPELAKINPAQVVMSIGSNDIRFGTSLAQTEINYDSIVRFFKNANIPVYHIVVPEDSTGGGVGLSDLKAWVAGNYGSDYIDVWTLMSTGNKLKTGYQADAVHFNQAGMKVIDSLITLSGKLVNTNDRTYQIRTTDGRIKLLNDSLYLDPSFTAGSSGSGISGLSTNVIPKATSSTTIADGSITDGASLTTISNPAIINSTFKAGTNVLAADAPLTFANPTNLPSFSFYRASSGTDEKIWNWYIDDVNMYMRTVNDAQNADATAIRFHRSGNAVDYVQIGGNLGIGVTPSNKLDVNGASTFAGNMLLTGMLTTTGSSAGILYNRRDNSANAWGILSLAGNLDFFDMVAGAEKFNILPGGKLHIYDTSRVDARMSYNSNLHSTFTTHSLVDKDYVDSIFAGGSADGNGIYSGNGSLPSNVIVTGANNSLTFDDIFAFKINSDYNTIAKANGTGMYTEAVIGAPNTYEIGYTPVAGIFSKGAGVFIDTNNNVGMGTNPPTAMPLYATGASTFIQGLQSNHGNFYKVSNITVDGSASIQAYFYTIDATAGNVTVTLPAASTAFGNTMGITYKFQRIDASGNTVTIQRAGSDTINGVTSFTLTTQWGVKMMQCTSASTWAQY